MHSGRNSQVVERDKTVATSSEAKLLDGSYGGFQPKPAVEIIIVCMKPLSEKTYVEQALKNGKGATWLDKCKIPTEHPIKTHGKRDGTGTSLEWSKYKSPEGYEGNIHEGRFPANLLVSDGVLNVNFQKRTGKSNIKKGRSPNLGRHGIYGKSGIVDGVNYLDSGFFSRYFDLDAWWLKTVENLPENVKRTFPFLICPKASKSERNKGCESLPEVTKSNLPLRDGTGNYVENTMGDGSKSTRATKTKNFHPTVKPVKLMSYLVTLGSREDDVVLDPFVGSGTTCLASKILNRQWIGIDINPKYCEIARKRIVNVPEKLEKFMGLKRIKQ